MSLANESVGGIQPNRLRLWPGVAIVAAQWMLRFGAPMIAPETTMYAVIGGVVGGLVVLGWWIFFSRAALSERLAAVVLMIAGLTATPLFLHKSIATGFRGMLFPLFAIPVLSLALVAWAVASRHITGGLLRHATMAAAVLAACGGWTLVRTDGVIRGAGSQFAWRWTKTHEERLLARIGKEPLPPPAPPPVAPGAAPARTEAKSPPKTRTAPPVARRPETPAGGADWPGFRGPQRDSVVRGSRIKTDWAASPPVQLWRREVGPGWSSVAVRDGLLYTQEQRGDFEVVTCYRLATGEPVWTHRDAARFWESNGGPGPRGTPAVSNGRVYAFGATGILNALDARSGAVVWRRDAAADTGSKVPGWGFASSPLVLEESVVIAASGRLAAYDLATGSLRWVVQTGGGSYSSPQSMNIDGVAQLVLLNGTGATSVAPADGKVLWKHAWPGSTILQPASLDGGVLITTSGDAGGLGTRRLAVAQGPGGWTADERWTSTGLKPYFNDLVVHKGHAFGFDSSILACIDLQDGRRKWKGGRYGHGQLLLLSDQDLLLVLSEEGELALVAAAVGQFTEVSRFRVMEGKSWNHPVLVGDTLLVRNGEEMAAFRLPLAGALQTSLE